MSDNKSINIRAVDSGVNQLLDSYRQKTEQTASSIIASLKDQQSYADLNIKSLEKEIELLNRKNRIQDSLSRKSIAQNFDNDPRVEFGGEKERNEALREKEDSLMKLDEQKKEQEITNLLLRQMIDEQKRGWENEIREDRRGVEKNIANAKASMFSKFLGGKDFEGMDESEIIKLKYQESLLNGSQQSEFGGNFAKGANNIASIAMDPIGAISKIAAAGFSIGVPVAFALAQGNKMQGAARGARGMFSLNDYDSFGGGSIVSTTTKFGMSRGDILEFATQVASATLSAKDIERESINLAALNVAYNIDQGRILSLAKFNRADSSGLSVSASIQQLIENFERSGVFSGGDYSSLNALIEIQNELLSQQVQIMENPSSTQNLKMMATFNAIGGSFANPLTMGNRLSTANEAIRNPQGDFQKAFIFSNLRSLQGNQGKSYFELLEEMENGLTPELLSSLVDNLSGSDEMKMLGIKELFGFSAQQSRQLYEGFSPGNIPSITAPSGSSSIERASSITPPIITLTKTIEDTFGKGGAKLIDGVDSMINKLGEFLGIQTESNNSQKEIAKNTRKIADEMEEFNRTRGLGNQFPSGLK